MSPAHEDLLRRLALNQEDALRSVLGAAPGGSAQASGLDPESLALVQLAGLVALAAEPASYQWGVASALAAGATDGEIVGVLVALTPIAGTARVSAAAPEVALALGCDIELPGGS